MKYTDVVISPATIDALLSICLAEDPEDVDALLKELVQEVIDAARIFIGRFEDSYFLYEESSHEFVGITYRNEETGLKEEEIRFRLKLNRRNAAMGIFTVDEVHLDDMYDIRHLIAESQLPEFREL